MFICTINASNMSTSPPSYSNKCSFYTLNVATKIVKLTNITTVSLGSMCASATAFSSNYAAMGCAEFNNNTGQIQLYYRGPNANQFIFVLSDFGTKTIFKYGEAMELVDYDSIHSTLFFTSTCADASNNQYTYINSIQILRMNDGTNNYFKT